MKKLYTTLVAILAIVHVSYGQWLTNGNNIYNTNTGNVGIGTNVPGNSLSFRDLTVDSGTSGITWYSPDPLNYGISKTAGAWSAPNYTQLAIKWMGGIILNPGTDLAKSYVDVGGGGLRVTSGNLGIGVTATSSKLQIGAGTSNLGSSISMLSGVSAGGAVNVLSLVNNASAATGNEVDMTFHTAGNYSPTSQIGAISGATPPTTDLAFSTYNGGLTEKMRILGNGFVGIGTATPKETLSVNGNIRSKQVKVETLNWPDYVFKKEYTLPSLSEVKTYIDQNQHLPEMPSAEEIAKDGLNLGEMNKLLMKKVEELTLYLIEKDKQLNEQQKQLNAQQLQMNQFKMELNSIKKSSIN